MAIQVHIERIESLPIDNLIDSDEYCRREAKKPCNHQHASRGICLYCGEKGVE